LTSAGAAGSGAIGLAEHNAITSLCAAMSAVWPGKQHVEVQARAQTDVPHDFLDQLQREPVDVRLREISPSGLDSRRMYC
jgi:hypothetical protein